MYTAEQLYNYIENNLEDYEVIMLNNELALKIRDDSAYIYDMEECFEDYAEWMIAKDGVLSLMNSAYFGIFNPNDEYYHFNGYANLISISKYDVKYVALENIQDMIDGKEDFVYDQLLFMNREEEEIKEYIDSNL